MNQVLPEMGSYRDFRGRIFTSGGRIFRTIMPVAADDFDFVRSTALIEELVAAGQLVEEQLVDPLILGDSEPAAAFVLEHPRLPFLSWPYEWSFSLLKAAALLHLEIHLKALDVGITLSDASAYNVQFRGIRPIFIDSLSFCRYKEGEFWLGHRQFCEQFVNPLLLRSCLGLPHNTWYRGALEGIGTCELSDMLSWHHKLSWHVLTNVALQGRLQRSSSAQSRAARHVVEKKLPRAAFRQMLEGMRRWITGLRPKGSSDTIWQSYPEQNSYQSEDAAAKRDFIATFAAQVRPALLWDIGCNTGDYAAVALASGAKYVVGFDSDHGALERAIERSSRDNLDFLPLYLDVANPSPSQGWAQAERQGLQQRGPADAVIALAVVHHLAISNRIPLDLVLDSLIAMAPAGVIEFVPRSDSMVQQMLQLREDHFDGYDQTSFESLLADRARIVRSASVSDSGRRLYWFSRS